MKRKWQERKRYCLYDLILMLGILGYYLLLSGAELQTAGVPVLMIIGVFTFQLLAGKLPSVLQWGIVLASPAALFLAMEACTHELAKMNSGPVFLSLLFYYLLFFLLFLVTGRAKIAVRALAIAMAIITLVNYFTLQFRSSPLLPWDLYSAGVAMSVMRNFKYELTLRACNSLLVFAAVFALSQPVTLRIGRGAARFRAALTAAAAVCLLVLCKGMQSEKVADRFHFNIYLFNPVAMYRDNGFAVSFIMNLQYVRIEKPDGYSPARAQQIQESLSAVPEPEALPDIESLPNIIVVMNEAFSDLSVLGEFETNMDVMPFLHSLQENTQKGWMYMSVKGGNTANSEFEFLTSSSLYWLPAGSVAYQQYVRSDLPGLADQLGQAGYRTIAMHPYYASGWNRTKVYSLMHFSETYFLRDFQDPELIRSYVSDQATFDKIKELYEEKEQNERLFVFDVTMQNHGSYYRSFDNFTPDVTVTGGSGAYLASTQQYLSLIRRSDEAFQNLAEYFAGQEEPTILLMFGDHQPADYVVQSIRQVPEDTLEHQQLRYVVPFILWANYEIPEVTEAVTSPNYLGIRLLRAAGIPLTPWQDYLEQLSGEIPVITGNMAIDASGNYYRRRDPALESILEDYAILQYNDLGDSRHRLEHFFTY